METIRHILDNIKLSYPISTISNPEDILFIDIETTGFTAKTSKLYLIGCVFFEYEKWQTVQFFANDYSDEAKLLEEFFYFAKKYKKLIHFNGNNFDIPYILDKCKEFNLDYNFDSFEGIDIYKRVQPLKPLLKIENCKQKTIEKFLKIDREDIYSGGDLIGIYHEYVKSKDEDLKEKLLLHNFEDIAGMLELLPILSYSDLFNQKVKVLKVSASSFIDINGADKEELLMAFELPNPFPIPVTYLTNGIYFTGNGTQALLRVPIYNGELKYFFANFKDYYYLPFEDIALHKSVAAFVDKDKREQAKVSNCYTKKLSRFLPQWEPIFEPFFKESYNSKITYFELTDERKTDRQLFSDYANHILANLL